MESMPQGSKSGFDYYYFFEYLPKRYVATPHQQQIRNIVYAFKDGRLPKINSELVKVIEQLLEGNRSEYALCCIPASTQNKTKIRFETLINNICSSLGIINGYDIISVKEDHEAQHLSGHTGTIVTKLNFDQSIINGKTIILIDDVITRGKSFSQVASQLKKFGASKIIGIFIAKTINPDWEE